MVQLSYAFGIPLADEQGIGPLTLGKYLRALAGHFEPREMAVPREGEQIERWS